MFYKNKIKTLHLELSSNCNASCPMCTRNNSGYGLNPNLKVTNWTYQEVIEKIPIEFILDLKRIMLCGNFGDPLLCPDLVVILEYFKKINNEIRLELHTNGGVGSVATWKSLAGLVSFCRFGIDGLEDTNHIYRKGVSWPRLMSNIQTYVSSGGVAEWAYLIFKHNEHQVNQAEDLSKKLGFKKFIKKNTSRHISSDGEIIQQWPVYTNNSNTPNYSIQVSTNETSKNKESDFKSLIENNKTYLNYLDTIPISCKVQNDNSIYLSADGLLVPCCWPGIDHTNKSSKNGLKDLLLKKNIDSLNLNIKKNSLDHVLRSGIFELIEESWSKNDRIHKCAKTCGIGFDPFGRQFE